MLKADTQVNVALDTRLEHGIKWTRKNSVTVYSESQFHQAIDSPPDDQQSVMQVKSRRPSKRTSMMSFKTCGITILKHFWFREDSWI